MASGFVTQSLAEEPLVVLITEQLDLSQLRVSFKQQGLETAVFHPTEITGLDFAWPSEPYKAVWILSAQTPLPLVKKTAEFLKASSFPITTVVLGFTPTTDNKPLLSTWRQASEHQQQLLSELRQLLPAASALVLQDVIVPTWPALPALQVMVQLLPQNTLLDPEVPLFPQPWLDVSPKITRLLIKPNLPPTLVKGKKITTTTLAKVTQLHLQRQTNNLPTIETLSTRPIHIGGTEVVENFTSYSVDELADVLTTLQPVVSLAPAVESPPPLPKRPAPMAYPVPVVRSEPPPKPTSESESAVAPPTPLSPPPQAIAKDNETNSISSTTSSTDVRLDGEVERLFQSYRSDHKTKRVKNIATSTVKTTKKNKRKSTLFKGGIAAIFVAVMVVFLAVAYVSSTWALRRVVTQGLRSPSATIPVVLSPLAKAVALQHQLYGLVLDESLFSQNAQVVNIATTWPQLIEQETKLNQLTQQAYLQITGKQTGPSFDTIGKAAVTAQSLYELIGQNEAWIKDLDLSDNPILQSQISNATEALNQQKKSLLPIQQLQPLIPRLLGADGRKTYAVIFQNPQELRPTGGFIQSVALLTFDQGTLINTQVVSPYELDTSVAGVVEPPLDLKQLLGEQQWFFRDSNWQPDFPTSADQMTWFIEKGLNQQVDGVVGLNAYVLEDILRAVGPVELPEYNEVITDRNLLERLEFHSELQLVDPQKDYSTLLFNRVLQKMSNIPPDKTASVMDALRSNFEAKQMTISLKDDAEELTFGNLGWTGALLSPSCPSQLAQEECFVDTVAQVETNVGVNKANAYIERQIDHRVELSPTGATHHRTMTFENTASSNAWPKGTYKNYLRLYVPSTAVLNQVLINGTPLPLTQVVTHTESGKKVFGMLVEVPIDQTVKAEVDYTIPQTFPDQFAYALLNQQQPGVVTPPLKISVEHPTQLQPTLIAPQAVVEENSVVFDQLPLPHSFVGIVFK